MYILDESICIGFIILENGSIAIHPSRTCCPSSLTISLLNSRPTLSNMFTLYKLVQDTLPVIIGCVQILLQLVFTNCLFPAETMVTCHLKNIGMTNVCILELLNLFLMQSTSFWKICQCLGSRY